MLISVCLCTKQDDHTGKNLLVEYPYPATERYKLSVVGDGECGKTSLLNALVKSDFDVSTSLFNIVGSVVGGGGGGRANNIF